MLQFLHVTQKSLRYKKYFSAGAKLSSISRAVAMASEVVITMAPNSPQVEEVVAGSNGIFDGARKGLIIVDMSTISPTTSHKMAEVAASKGVHFLDAPVSGGSQGAEQGTLTIMVGGEYVHLSVPFRFWRLWGKGTILSTLAPAAPVRLSRSLIICSLAQLQQQPRKHLCRSQG